MNEWENQQIRKGVTAAQLVTAQQESIYSQYMIKQQGGFGGDLAAAEPMSTGNLLEQAYARSALERPRKMMQTTQKQQSKASGPRAPAEVAAKLGDRLTQVRELHERHVADIDAITTELRVLKMDELQCEQRAPIAAVKYRFYQELRAYVTDLVECLDEKLPAIVELERRSLACMSKQASLLLERRRQDVRDQAKEMAESGSEYILYIFIARFYKLSFVTEPGAAKKMLDDEERVRRAADREGRRTRRRQIRERIDINNTHLDGMSSDDEIHKEHDTASYRAQLGDFCSIFSK